MLSIREIGWSKYYSNIISDRACKTNFKHQELHWRDNYKQNIGYYLTPLGKINGLATIII